MRYHLIREQVANGTIEVHYTSTSDESGDMLTKSLTGPLSFYAKYDLK